MTDVPFPLLRSSSGAFWTRVLAALIQAVALYWLVSWRESSQGWWIDNPAAFDPLFVNAICLPVVAMLGVGQAGWRELSAWIVVVACALAFLTFHEATRGTVQPFVLFSNKYDLPWNFWVGLTTALFIAQALALDSITARSWTPPYLKHFDTAWRQGVQLSLSAAFVGVFWGVLWMGAALFNLVELDFFHKLIEHRWFSIPATTLALAVALHVTDVQPQIIRGARGLALTLLSWLLPVLAALVGAFVVVLPFVSLAPLWRTHFAARLLLSSVALLVFLINCAFQDGGEGWSGSRAKRLAAYGGSLELLSLLVLAAWALAQRVDQYGWTVQRIEAAAVAAVGVVYTLGYILGLIQRSWPKWLERANVVAAYLIVALIVAFHTPLGDPGRLMVADQIARLKSGAVAVDRFDFIALKFDGARWGAEALKELSASPDETTRDSATRAQAGAVNYGGRRLGGMRIVAADERAQRIDVFPAGRTLPPEFLVVATNPGSVTVNSCFYAGANHKCTAQFIQLAPGKPEAIVFSDGNALKIYESDDAQHWRASAQLVGQSFCATVRDAIKNGALTADDHPYKDIVVGGQRLVVTPTWTPCAPR